MGIEQKVGTNPIEAVVRGFDKALPTKPIYYFKDTSEGGGKFTGPERNMFHLQDVVDKTDLGKLLLTNNIEPGKPTAYLLLATNFPGWDLRVVELDPFNKRIDGKPNGLIVQQFKRGIKAKEVVFDKQPINVLLYQVGNRAVTNTTVMERLKKVIGNSDTQPTALQLLLKELKTIDINSNEAWKTASIIELTGEDLKSNLMVYLYPKPEKPEKKIELKKLKQEDRSQGAQKSKPPPNELGKKVNKPAKKVKQEGAVSNIQKVDPQKTENLESPTKKSEEISPEIKKLKSKFILKLIKGFDTNKIEYLFLDDIKKGILYDGILNLWSSDSELKEGLIPNFETFIVELKSLDDPKKIGIEDELISSQYLAMRSIILGLNGKQSSDFSSHNISLIRTKTREIKEGKNKEEVEKLLKEITGKIQSPSTRINNTTL